MSIQDRAGMELASFITQKPNPDNISGVEGSNTDLQDRIDKGAAKMAILHDWPFAASIPYISALVTIYGSDPRDIVIYGAGPMGRDALSDLSICNLTPKCFCDSNPAKWGTNYHGYPVISTDELMRRHKADYIVISSVRYMHNIFYDLIEMGMAREHIYIPPFEPIYNITRK